MKSKSKILNIFSGLSARIASGPLGLPLINRIDKAFISADPQTGLTNWQDAAELIGEDQTFGRMLLDMLPPGLVSYKYAKDVDCSSEELIWPVVNGMPCRAELLLLRFNTKVVSNN